MKAAASLSRRQHVVEVAEVIGDADEVEHAEQAAQGDAHAVGAAEAAELPAPFHVRLQFQKYAWNAAALEPLFQSRDRLAEVAEDCVVGAFANVGRHEILERRLVEMLGALPLAGMAVVFDVNPADAWLHRLIMLEHLARREALRDEIARVEHQHQGRMIHLPMDFGEDQSVLPDKIRLDLQAKGEVRAMAALDNLPDLIDHLRHVRPRIGPPWMIKRKAADQLRLEGVGKLANPRHLFGQILGERHIGVLRAILFV